MPSVWTAFQFRVEFAFGILRHHQRNLRCDPLQLKPLWGHQVVAVSIRSHGTKISIPPVALSACYHKTPPRPTGTPNAIPAALQGCLKV